MPKDGPIIVRRTKPQGVALPPPPELTGQSPDDSNLPAPVQASEQRLITQAEFQRLGDMPPEAEWFANITNPNTRRANRNDVGQLMKFVGIEHFTDFRIVARAHVIAWRKTLEKKSMSPVTIRRKLSALSAPPLLPTLSNTGLTSRGFRSGSVIPTFPPPACTTKVRVDLRTRLCSKFRTKYDHLRLPTFHPAYKMAAPSKNKGGLDCLCLKSKNPESNSDVR